MRSIFLARHGETAWNALHKLQGHTDVPLNETGRAQALALAELLLAEKITSVITSDLARARETGALIASRLAIAAPHTDSDLRERRFGIFEGLTREECAAQHPDAWRAWMAESMAPRGGEPAEEIVLRMTRALGRIIDDGDHRPALVISHGGVMGLWLRALLGPKVPPIGNGSVYVLQHDGARFDARPWEPEVA